MKGLVKEKQVKKGGFADWISVPLLVPNIQPAYFRVTINLGPPIFDKKKDERPVPSVGGMLLQATD